MAVDEATKKQDELELYQIDDKAIVPFFREHLDDLKKFLDSHKGENLSLFDPAAVPLPRAYQGFADSSGEGIAGTSYRIFKNKGIGPR